MEVLNPGLTPEQRKRTFIASMNKYNPYRISRFTESVYDRILLNRETLVEVKVESPRDPKAIYLPPVRIEDSSKKFIKKRARLSTSIPSSHDSTPKDYKIESFQLLSKSLDFNMVFHEKVQSPTQPQKRKTEKTDIKSKTFQLADLNSKLRTTSALQDRRNSLKIPSKFRENLSPWIFRTSQMFQL
jgi:hypothetical protein